MHYRPMRPAQVRNADVKSQSLYRGHQGHVVFLAFLSDAATLISVDSNGAVRAFTSLSSFFSPSFYFLFLLSR